MGGYRRRWTAAGLGRRPARGPLRPLDDGGALPIANLLVHLDARFGIAEAGGAGTGVSGWEDQSGNGNDASQTVDGRRPSLLGSVDVLGGQPAVSFNGTSDFLDFPTWTQAASPYTAYFVARKTAAVSDAAPFLDSLGAAGGNAERTLLGHFSGEYATFDGTGRQFTNLTEGADTGTFVYQTDGTATRFWLNGVAGTPQAWGGDRPFNSTVRMGALATTGTNNLPADICAAFVYTAAHDAAERAAVQAYITQEWGI